MALTLFGEGPGRFLVSAQPARVTALSTLARELGAPVIEIGTLTAEPALRVSTQGPGTGQGDSASADRPWTVDLAPLRRLSARVFGPALPDPYP